VAFSTPHMKIVDGLGSPAATPPAPVPVPPPARPCCPAPPGLPTPPCSSWLGTSFRIPPASRRSLSSASSWCASSRLHPPPAGVPHQPRPSPVRPARRPDPRALDPATAICGEGPVAGQMLDIFHYFQSLVRPHGLMVHSVDSAHEDGCSSSINIKAVLL
jgi:hypothetical protein